ncbi:MAG TPA: TolC family protein [Verrucomicrobiae bacterium]|nr:TolC family protein [Verrucomicrobiae bacterium]
MLRITVDDDQPRWRMRLEGKLAAAWVTQAADAWRTARTAGRVVEVDLTGVTVVDAEGLELLRAMKESGAQLRAKGVEMEALVGEMSKDPCKSSCGWVRHLFAILLLAMLAGVASLPAQPAAPPPLRLTLKQAVDLALRQNPQVAIANLNVAESQESGSAARSRLLPQASFEASEAVNRQNVEALLGVRVPGFPGHTGPFWVVGAGTRASVPLFELTLWQRWQSAREAVRASRADQATARELNAQLVVSQYLGSLRAAADVEAAKSRLDLARALFDLASDLQKNGAGTGIDTLRAHVQYQNEVQRSAEADAQLKIALYGLNRLLNLDPQQPIELADQPSFFETPAVSLDEDLARAYQSRPEMQAVLSQERAAELAKRAARSQSLPALSLAGGWSLQGTAPTNMIPVYEIGASLNVPLFTGGRIQAETAAQDIELKKLSQAERDLRNQIALEVKSAAVQIGAARIEVDAANLGVNLAAESVRQARDRFRAGVANNIEVITAQDELARANDNQIAALYRYNQSRADLARATGKMEELYAK